MGFTTTLHVPKNLDNIYFFDEIILFNEPQLSRTSFTILKKDDEYILTYG